ncbi:50S ribosomal protein L11 methyltransferase [Tyzzerella sp. OttesenSCG-928-J15]|nr:50S ribosomal protein L11 methyltransferase [Tyzzerella sp. OttesenSCG-928-J15]
MEWTEVRIHTSSEGVEALCALLMELGCGAVQIEDSAEMKTFLEKDERNWDYVDEELLNIKEDYVFVQVYLTHDDDGEKLFESIKYGIGELKKMDLGIDMGSLDLEYRVRNDEEWVDNWKKYYKPLEIGEKIVIKPEWENYDNKDNKIVFNINPGHLFGTGLHQTTQLCLEHLEKLVGEHDTVVDIGCGSGILSCVALMLGAENAFALDLEPGCVKVVGENAELNAISMDKLKVKSGNALTDNAIIAEIKEKKYTIVVANIVADVIIALLPLVKDVLEEKGSFICSGIIKERLDDVHKALEQHGFTIITTTFKDDWVSVVSKVM